MDTDHGHLAAASISTLEGPGEAEGEGGAPVQTSKVAGAGQTAAGLGRWSLLLLSAVIAPVALVMWAVLPRVTSPAALVDEAIDVGLTETARAALVDQLSTELADRRNIPIPTDQMRSVFDRSLTQGWFDEQLTSVAGELDAWFAGSDDEAPSLLIDLVPVKASLAADPEAIRLVAELIGGDEGVVALEGALAGVPDQVSLLSGSEESGPVDGLLAAREVVNATRGPRGMVPPVLLAVFAMIVVLARRGTRLRWAGSVLLVVALPILTVAAVMPGWAGRQAVSLAPAEVALEAAEVEALLSWIFNPARSLALWTLVAGLVAVAASVAAPLLQGRSR